MGPDAPAFSGALKFSGALEFGQFEPASPLTTQLARCESLRELELLAARVGEFSPEQVFS